MRIEVSMFTNSTKSAPDPEMICRTYCSFCKTFGHFPAKVFCDPHPNILKARCYLEHLRALFPTVIETSSLSDGYIASVKSSDADFLFQLEHDWEFTDQITHSLEEIVSVMRSQDIVHLRFNKRSNRVAGWDERLEEREADGVAYCITTCMSNNPHIINRSGYADKFLGLIRRQSGSKGIEDSLLRRGFSGAIYGGLKHPATVIHIDGRQGGVSP